MALVIEDNETIAQIERLAANAGLSAVEAVRRAVQRELEMEPNLRLKRERTPEQVHEAIERAQTSYALSNDPNRHKTPDEIIGYNEHGHLD